MRGFTLIELLIVIGIIGVLATMVLMSIDPPDKLNAANDSKVQRDVNTLARAMEAYAASHNSIYPTNGQADLFAAGELKIELTPPSGYNNYIVTVGPPALVSGELKSKKNINEVPPKPAFVWCNTSDRAAATVSQTTCP